VAPLLLDGEVVVLRKNGSSSFQALQNTLSNGNEEGLNYFVFDILHCGGYDLTEVALAERKAFLRRILDFSRTTGMVRFSDHQAGKGDRFSQMVCKIGLEGIASKRADSPYRPARSRNWLKIKCMKRQEFVIGGFTDPGGGLHAPDLEPCCSATMMCREACVTAAGWGPGLPSRLCRT